MWEFPSYYANPHMSGRLILRSYISLKDSQLSSFTRPNIFRKPAAVVWKKASLSRAHGDPSRKLQLLFDIEGLWGLMSRSYTWALRRVVEEGSRLMLTTWATSACAENSTLGRFSFSPPSEKQPPRPGSKSPKPRRRHSGPVSCCLKVLRSKLV